jgi:hypothetical protein
VKVQPHAYAYDHHRSELFDVHAVLYNGLVVSGDLFQSMNVVKTGQ